MNMNWWVISTKRFVHSKLHQILSYFSFAITEYTSISAFASLINISMGTMSSRKKHNEIALSAKK